MELIDLVRSIIERREREMRFESGVVGFVLGCIFSLLLLILFC